MSSSIDYLLWADLPGGEYLPQGLDDLRAGRESLPSLLLSIAPGRLAEAGLVLPSVHSHEPELRLYRLLQVTHDNEAHSQYNAHTRRLNKLCRALELAQKRGWAVLEREPEAEAAAP